MELYLTLEDIKAHLRIDNDDEDRLLTLYCLASQRHVETIIHRPLVDESEDAVCTCAEDLPEDIKQYILCLIGDMYKYRENKQEKTFATYFDHLLDGYVKYD